MVGIYILHVLPFLFIGNGLDVNNRGETMEKFPINATLKGNGCGRNVELFFTTVHVGKLQSFGVYKIYKNNYCANHLIYQEPEKSANSLKAPGAAQH